MMKHSSRQSGNVFLVFGCQREKFSCISACIRCNFMPSGILSFPAEARLDLTQNIPTA